MSITMQFIAAALLFASPQKQDSDFVSLSRDGCYGECPIYTVTVYSDGNVCYFGKQFVKVVGERRYTISKDSVALPIRQG